VARFFQADLSNIFLKPGLGKYRKRIRVTDTITKTIGAKLSSNITHLSSAFKNQVSPAIAFGESYREETWESEIMSDIESDTDTDPELTFAGRQKGRER